MNRAVGTSDITIRTLNAQLGCWDATQAYDLLHIPFFQHRIRTGLGLTPQMESGGMAGQRPAPAAQRAGARRRPIKERRPPGRSPVLRDKSLAIRRRRWAVDRQLFQK